MPLPDSPWRFTLDFSFLPVPMAVVTGRRPEAKKRNGGRESAKGNGSQGE